MRAETTPTERSETGRHWDITCFTPITIGAAAFAAAVIIAGIGQREQDLSRMLTLINTEGALVS